MRHRVAGKQLSRTTSHRRALRRNMAASLIQHGAIRTTEAKAKELRRFAEKLVTLARKGTLHARRLVSAELGNRRGQRGELFNAEEKREEKGVLQKLFDEIAPRYADRPGGYTRVIHLAERRLGDAGRQVILQLVEEASGDGDASSEKAPRGRRRRRAAARQEAAVEASGPAEEVEETGAAEQGDADVDASADPPAEPSEPAEDAEPDEADGGEEKKQ